MPLSVASVTTAFNAAKVLPRQMDALLRQSRPLQEMIVIDNGSTDGTCELLANNYPQVTVLKMPGNLGAAGAWSAGLDYAALRRRHDWIWGFDDDSVPDHRALEGLMSAAESSCEDAGALESSNRSLKTGMVAMLPVHQSGACYPPLLWREGFHKPSSDILQKEIWFADLAIASGLMVSRDLVETVGLPRADFFMDFFDFEYCLRARSAGYRIAVANGVKLSHEVGDARPVRLPGYSALWPDHAPWREYYMSRNLIYVAWWLYPSPTAKRSVIRHMLRHACGSMLFGSKKIACVKKMAQGFFDGSRARLGIRFLPTGNSQ
jgi:rhamnopyranosyl-N-acetylglucosaminyl-diphospho-decaprenol beta-1,3/1,4-galactofuranosyltransferase